MRSKVENYNGIPSLFVNDKPVNSAAYITYLEENACYEDFARAGYKLYSFTAYFASRPVNATSGLKAFKKGIFDNRGQADFETFDADVRRILEACPDAYIFPRVSVNMPLWWEEDNPSEINRLLDGSILRESFSSKKWRDDVSNRLIMLIDYVNQSDYKDNIVGYHIAGGQTEEFYHFASPNGGFGDSAKRGFIKYVKEAYGEDIDDFPSYDFGEEEFLTDKKLIRFFEYTSLVIAESICHFASVVKEHLARRLIVGSFYGYTMEIGDARFGHFALERVLKCKDIDFLSAPNSYLYLRQPGIDWPNMSVLDSIKLNGKLFFTECDVRTFLTKPLLESRANSCLPGVYEGGVWQGPESKDVSRWVLRNCFARQLTHGCGLWWFDMWGGWFANEDIMKDMEEYRLILQDAMEDKKRESLAQVAIIVDEKSYKYINPSLSLGRQWNGDNRYALGLAAAPYDIYDIYDIDKIRKDYKLVIFLACLYDDGRAKKYIEQVTKTGTKIVLTYKPFAISTNKIDMKNENIIHNPHYSFNTLSLRELYKKARVHIYTKTDDVIYVNENYISIHSQDGGDKEIFLDRKRRISPLFSDEEGFYSDKIITFLKENETKVYRLD